MITERWLLIGKDLRIEKSAEILSTTTRHIKYVPVDRWDENLEKICKEFNPHCIVFPIQPMTIDKETIDRECFRQNPILFFGRVSDTWKEFTEQNGLITKLYLQDEQFIWQNAKLTAEGFIAAFYENNRLSINGRTFHITGFGRVAKMLASILCSMGAKVFVFARSEKIVCEAKAYGYDAAILSPNQFKNQTIAFLLNTIPAHWFTTEYEKVSSSSMFIYDLASSPGCLAEGVQQQEAYILLPGLPGLYFATDAAGLLSETISKIYNLEKEQQNA